MAADKTSEKREDQIIKRLTEIEQALEEVNSRVSRLRRERVDLWREYRNLLAGRVGNFNQSGQEHDEAKKSR